jgi:hypothetical protein
VCGQSEYGGGRMQIFLQHCLQVLRLNELPSIW